MSKIIFIQANSSEKVFRIIKEGLFKKSAEEIADILNIATRQGDYNRSACVFFGFLEKSQLEEEYILTKSGLRIFNEKDLEKSKEIFSIELRKSDIVSRIFKNYKSFEDVESAYYKNDRNLITIFNDYGFSRLNKESTRFRRVQGCFFKWLETIYDEYNLEQVWKKNENKDFSKKKLVLTKKPVQTKNKSKSNTARSNYIKIDYVAKQKKNQLCGLVGEKYVVDYEKNRLSNEGRGELAKKVEHVSQTIGDGLGYDIVSYNVDGTKRFIEVKSTVNANGLTSFFISKNELDASKKNKEYFLYRVYDLNRNPKLYITKGAFTQNFDLECVSFKTKG